MLIAWSKSINHHLLFMFFWLEPKEPKVQAKNKCSAVFGRPTHINTPIILNDFYYWGDRTKLMLHVICKLKRRCLFRLYSLEILVNYWRRKRRRWKIKNADIKQKHVEEIINQENKLQLSSMQMIRIVLFS